MDIFLQAHNSDYTATTIAQVQVIKLENYQC